MSRQIMFYGAPQKPEQHDRGDFLRAETGRITQRSKPVSGPTFHCLLPAAMSSTYELILLFSANPSHRLITLFLPINLHYQNWVKD